MNTGLARNILAILLAMPFISSASDEESWKYRAPPSVKTITLGSPVSIVFKKMGSPEKILNLPPSEMGMPASQQLIYPGMTIGAYRSDKKMEAHVWSVKVTGKQVVIYPGITIGMTKEALIKLLGKPYSEESRESGQWLVWISPEPVLMFHVILKNNRIVKFEMAEDWS
jgi:hypothetical protein